jgi:palmitoyltransferase
MAVNSLNFAFKNLTTIENLDKKFKIWEFVVRLPDPGDPNYPSSPKPSGHPPRPLRTVAFQVDPPGSGVKGGAPSSTAATDDSGSQEKTPITKYYALMHTEQGENPWDVSPVENFKSVMGNYLWDWVLPLRASPCATHDRTDAQFITGAVVERLRKEARQRMFDYTATVATTPAPYQPTTEANPTTEGAAEEDIQQSTLPVDGELRDQPVSTSQGDSTSDPKS